MKAFVIMGRILKATYEDLFLVVYLSVVWWIGQVLIITAAPATVGINKVFNRAANYKRTENGFFWEGAKEHIGRGWLLYLIMLLVPVALGFNIAFYGNSQGAWRIFSVFWIWAFVVSIMIAQYIFPLFWQQDEPDIKLVLRNATILAFKHPLYSFLLIIFDLILIVLSVALTLPALILLPGMLAISGNFALAGILQEMDLAPLPPEIPKR
jgi:uncharacterized membrane protein YesL